MSDPVPKCVIFKSEGEIDGVPMGPMRLVFEDDRMHDPQPYQPDRPREWVLRTEAHKIAEAAGVPLEEV